MAQIASENNVSKALLYHYYPSKELLIFDIGRTHLVELEAAIRGADTPDLPPARRLRQLITAVLENYRTADNYQQVLLNGTGALSPRPESRTCSRSNVASSRLLRYPASRSIRTIDSQRPLLTPVTMSLFGMLNWVHTWFRPDGPISRDEYAELVATCCSAVFKRSAELQRDEIEGELPATPTAQRLRHQRQHVILRDDLCILVGHRAVPAHLAIVFRLARADLPCRSASPATRRPD